MDSFTKSREESLITSLNSQLGLSFANTNNEKFINGRNLLTGYIQINLLENESFHIKTITTIGLLISHNFAIIPKHKFYSQIDNISSTILGIKYSPVDTKHKKEFTYSIPFDKIKEINIFTEETSWLVLVLVNPIGLYLLNYESLEMKYYTLNDNLPNKRSKFYFSSFIYLDNKDDNEFYTISLDNKILFFDDNKFYLAFAYNSKFLPNDGFVFYKNMKIIGIYEGERSNIIDCSTLKKLIKKEGNSNSIQNDLEKIIKGYYGFLKESEIRFLEIKHISVIDNEKFNIINLIINQKFGCDSNFLTTQLNYYTTFRDYFSSYERLLSLISVGPKILHKLSNQCQLDFKKLDQNYLIKKILNDEKNEVYNLETLDLVGYNLEFEHFKTIMESFYNSKNLNLLDLSESYISLDKAIIISLFLTNNSMIRKLHLRNTNMSIIELYLIINSIIQAKKTNISVLNLSNNNFYTGKNIVLKFETPKNLGFLANLFFSNNMRELYLMNLNFENKDLVRIFSMVNENLEVKNEEIEKDLKEMEMSQRCLRRTQYINIRGIRILNLSKNLIRKDSMEAISKYFFLSDSIEEIYLSDCFIDDICLTLLMDSLNKRSKKSQEGYCNLKILDLSRNKISWKVGNIIREFIKTISSNLNEENCIISHEDSINSGVKQTFPVKNMNEFTLILDDNITLSEGIAKICEGISTYSPLLNLSFKNVNLTRIDIEAIFNVISMNMPIKSISLAGNKEINDEVIESHNLSQSLRDNKSQLVLIDFHFTNVSIKGVYSLCKDLDNKKLKIICDPFNYGIKNYLDGSFFLLNHSRKDIKKEEELEYKKYEVVFNYVQFYTVKKKQ